MKKKINIKQNPRVRMLRGSAEGQCWVRMVARGHAWMRMGVRRHKTSLNTHASTPNTHASTLCSTYPNRAKCAKHMLR